MVEPYISARKRANNITHKGRWQLSVCHEDMISVGSVVFALTAGVLRFMFFVSTRLRSLQKSITHPLNTPPGWRGARPGSVTTSYVQAFFSPGQALLAGKPTLTERLHIGALDQ
jgi:hypothetical protein